MASKSHKTVNEDVGPGSQPKRWAAQTSHSFQTAQEVAQGENGQNEAPSHAPPSFKTSFTNSGKGGGAVRSVGEKMEVNAANGTLSFSIPIATSNSRSGFQPQLNLSYDSGHGNGPFGFGWGISIPSISRNTSREIPVYDDEKDVFMLTGLEDLVPLLDGTKLVETVVEEYCVRQYQPRVISDAIRIERWSRLADPEDVHWRTISNQNTTTIYGWTDNSRIVDRSKGPARIFSWLSCYSYDSYGNAMSYEYKSENGDGVEANEELLWEKNRSSQVRRRQRYIKSIKYGNKYPARDPADWDVVIQPKDWMFELIFDYGEHHETFPTTQEERPWPVRKDQFSRCNFGFEVRSYRLCRRFLMFHHFPDELKRSDNLVSSLNLIYHEEDHGTFLSSVTICGHSVLKTGGQAAYITETMPSIKFEYSTVPSPQELELISAQTADVLSLPCAGSTLAEWVDLNGEGIPGILSRQRDGRMWYQRNCSTLKGSPELEFGAAQCLTQQPSFGYKEGYYLEDLGGTGQLDLVCLDAQGRLHGYFERVNSELWADFATFTTIPAEPMTSQGLVRTDLTGNGLLDVLRPSDADHTSWQPCLGKAGFDEHRLVQFSGKDMPRMMGNDKAIYHADMTGDGLSDLVLIGNGDISYWANLGHGVFGTKTQMAHAPVFDDDISFSLSRVRLIDVDGSGMADLLYLLPEGGANLYYNLSGNSWSSAVLISTFPQIDQTSSVFALDLLGTGTACLCWSQPSLSAGGQSALRYLDLMRSQKPHLLMKVCNEMGSTTEASYTPSTYFYLQDEAESKPWTTKLPFPVQCVKELVTTDQITGIKKRVKYRYHDGYFDGEEREFRGFGMVEQINEEIFPLPGAKNFRDSCSMTRTWYNTGSAQPSSRTLFSAATIFDRLPAHLKAEDSRQAIRALRGTVHRSEVYDGEGWNTQSVPYTATESSHQIIDIQPCTPQTKHCIFRIAPSETIETVYEGQKRDTKVLHEIVLEINDYGDIQESAKIKYPRTMLEKVPALQAQSVAVIEVAQVDFTNAIYDAKSFRKPISSCRRSYSLPNVVIPSVLTTEKLKLLLKEQAALPTGKINTGEQRLYFTSTALDRRLPLGLLELYSIEAQTFDLAFTPEQLHKVNTQDPSLRGVSSKENLIAQAGYIDLDANGYLWRPSPVYGFRQTPQTKTELEVARTSFYVRDVTTDALGSVSFVEMDKYKLLCTSMTDSIGNKFSTINDYETLQPISITDLNMNSQHVTLDCFGCVLGIANQGKDGRREGESFDDFERYLLPEDVALFFEQPSEALAKKLLGSASDRTIYDLQRFSRNNSAGKDYSHPAPPAVAYLARDGPGDSSAFNIRIKLIYLDGSANPFQTFEYCGTESPRWRFGECVFANSKKMPVRRHRPIFTDNHRPFPVNEIGGVMSLTLHDALQRQVVEISPDGTWSKVRYLPWSKSEYDAGDTVLEANPASKSDVRSLTAQLLKDISWRSWYEIRTQGQSAEPVAAIRSRVYYDTPVITHWDPSGNALLTTESTNTQTQCLSYAYDIRGNVVAEYDSRHRVTSRYEFDSLNNCIYKEFMDGGKNWQILNSLGKAFVSWNSRQIMHRTVHDKLQREIEVWMSMANAPEKLVASSVYGESCPSGTEFNLRGQLWKQFDQSGVTKMTSYDRRGKCTNRTYQLCLEYKNVIDWKTQVELESKVWQQQTELNYFDEITKTCNANGKWTRKVYNALGEVTSVLMASSDADLALSKSWQPFILNSKFSADALPLVIEHGNGTVSSFEYDGSTRQLINKKVARQGGKILENTYYTYDCMRRIVRKVNSAEQDVFFRNFRIKPESEYTYDAFGQLIAATGREQIVLASGVGNRLSPYDASTGSSRSKLSSDGTQLCAYLEEYQYDLTGNLTMVKHSPRFDDKVQGWTRRYTYEHPNMLDSSTCSNRLSYTTVSGIEERYKYDGDAGEAGHITSMPGFSSITWGFSELMSSTSRQNVNDGTPETIYYVYNHKGDRIRKVCERFNMLQPVAEGQSIKRTDTIYLDDAEIFSRFSGNGTPASTRTSSHIISTSRFAMIEEDEALDEGPLIRYEVSGSLELDDTGQIVSYEEYAPYGACTFAASAKKVEADRRYRFARYLRDAETGLDHCGARYYVPWIGRWLSPDPIGSSGGVNLYCYSYNDPVNLKDPTGNVPREELDIPDEPKQHYENYIRSTKKTSLFSRIEGVKNSIEEWSQSRIGQTVFTLLSIAVPAVIALSGTGLVVSTAINAASAIYRLWGNIHNKNAETSWKDIISQELSGGLAAMIIGQIPGMTELVAHARQALVIAQDPQMFFASLFSTDYAVGHLADEVRQFMGDLGVVETMTAYMKGLAGLTGTEDALGEAGFLDQLQDHAEVRISDKLQGKLDETQDKYIDKFAGYLHDKIDPYVSRVTNAVNNQIAAAQDKYWPEFKFGCM